MHDFPHEDHVISRAILSHDFAEIQAWALAHEYYEDHGSALKDGALRFHFGAGEVDLMQGDGCTNLVLNGHGVAGSQGLRDLLHFMVTQDGFAIEWVEAPPPLRRDERPDNMYFAKVTKVEEISPSFRRVSLAGPELEALMIERGIHFRLVIGPQGADWPRRGEDGLTVWPQGLGAWHRPVYTVREEWHSGGQTNISFDIFLHEGGRVTDWSAKLQVGEEIALIGPSGGDIPEGVDWFGFYGDETALPAILRTLEALPTDAKGVAHILIAHPDDRQTINAPQGIPVHWHIRAPDESPSWVLTSALKCDDMPEESRFVFFASHKAEARSMRQHLLDKGLNKRDFWPMAFWG